MAIQRMGRIIGIKPENISEYKRLHADVWPQVQERLRQSNITNYSIYLREPENLLFAYWEYVGDDFAADRAKMAEDKATQEWWLICNPLQQSLPSAQKSEWWAPMEEVFHME
ncbi:L-rhamnose mutarotase [Polycladidibacter hongkongensis]|uniref:L-rhamnose mutarotase n=1 Tax=Polycladidibacter hongkongensis TaxID=1647556 RepID=UPI000AF240D8|nr:L-rhamnose mutarotase [Pseudovibrio hongkongensis]